MSLNLPNKRMVLIEKKRLSYVEIEIFMQKLLSDCIVYCTDKDLNLSLSGSGKTIIFCKKRLENNADNKQMRKFSTSIVLEINSFAYGGIYLNPIHIKEIYDFKFSSWSTKNKIRKSLGWLLSSFIQEKNILNIDIDSNRNYQYFNDFKKFIEIKQE